MTARRLLATLLGACLLVAGACSGDDDGDVATDRATTSTSARPDRTTTTDTESTTSTAGDTTTSTPGAGSSTTGAPSTPGTPGDTSRPTAPPATAAPTTQAPRAPGPLPLDQIRLRVRQVGTFQTPTVYRSHPTGNGYVGEQRGVVKNAGSGQVVLDIQDLVIAQGERGFLGMAFNGAGNRLYVSYSDRATNGDSVIAEYAFSGGPVNEGTRRELLRVDQPFANHNGGDIHVGPDGLLYIALGDGGSSGDPQGNGQNRNTLLGSILRIDPTRPGGGRQYGIPSSNPFAGGGGAPEIYLWGVRNPWRFSFDPVTRDLWVADVGQNAWEEITILPGAQGSGRGANLGWNIFEGTHVFAGGGTPSGYRGPVFEYPHSQGCSITGGHVYRGAAMPELGGAYLFADLCRSTIRALRVSGTTLVGQRTFSVDVGTPISFGVDPAGELLVLSQQGAIYRIERA